MSDETELKEVSVVLPQRPGAYESGAKDYEEWQAFWRKQVEDWQSSGLSQSAFCQQRKLVITTFNGWKRKFAGQAPGPGRHRAPRMASSGTRSPRPSQTRRSSVPAFVPVQLTPSSTGNWALEVQCANGRVLRLRDYLETQALLSLLRALEQRAC